MGIKNTSMWEGILTVTKSIAVFYRESKLGDKTESMIRQLQNRYDRLNNLSKEKGSTIVIIKQILKDAKLKDQHVPTWNTTFAVLKWLGINIQQFLLPQKATTKEIIKLIKSQLEDIADGLKGKMQFGAIQDDDTFQQDEFFTQSSFDQGGEQQQQDQRLEQFQTVIQVKKSGEQQIEILQHNLLNQQIKLSSTSDYNHQKYYILEEVRQKLKQPYYKILRQFLEVCKDMPIGLHKNLFGAYINLKLKSGCKDQIRNFIIINHQNSSISIGKKQYLINQKFIDKIYNSYLLRLEIECCDVWTEIINQYVSTIKKIKQIDFLYELNSEIYQEKTCQMLELSVFRQNIEHLIEDYLPMFQRMAKDKHKKIYKIIKSGKKVLCCHTIVQNRYQIVSDDDYECRQMDSKKLISEIIEASSKNNIKVFFVGIEDQYPTIQKIMKYIEQRVNKQDTLYYCYQMRRQKQKKLREIKLPQDINKKSITNITFQQFWKIVKRLNLLDIGNLVQLIQRENGYSEKIICILASIYNHFLKNALHIIAQCFKVDNNKATIAFYPKNGNKKTERQQQYRFQQFFKTYAYQILHRQGSSQLIARKAFQQMYQKAILHCLEQHLATYTNGYKLSHVLRLFIKEEQSHHTRIHFIFSKPFITQTKGRVTYQNIISTLISCFNKYGVLKHFDSHCCRLISQTTQIRPENGNRKTALLKPQLSNFTKQMSISYIQLRNKKEANNIYKQIFQECMSFSRSIRKQFGAQLEIQKFQQKNFYAISIKPKCLS